MTATNASQPGSLTVREKAKLRRVLGRRDLILFTASGIISLETVSFESSIGGESIVWLAVSFFLFLVPYGFLMAELASAFPVEGGPYEWARMAFGRLAGGGHRPDVLDRDTDLGRRQPGGRSDRHGQLLHLVQAHG